MAYMVYAWAYARRGIFGAEDLVLVFKDWRDRFPPFAGSALVLDPAVEEQTHIVGRDDVRSVPLQRPRGGDLERARAYYAKALAANVSFLPARLGLAWCDEHRGREQEAIHAYREILSASELALPRNGRIRAEDPDLAAIRFSARHLLRLVNKDTDEQEIQHIQQTLKELARRTLPRRRV